MNESHDWVWDEVFKVYRCRRCLVAGTAVHGPICLKASADPLAGPVKETS